MAFKSSGVSWLVVLVMTSPISLAGTSPSAVSPVVRKLRRSASLQFLRRVGVRLGATSLAPARNWLFLGAPRKLRGVWHSPQWPSAVTRYLPRFSTAFFATSGANGPDVKKSHFQIPTRKRQR